MPKFLLYVFLSAWVYFLSMAGVEYAYSKTEKVRRNLIILIMIVFSIFNGWAMSINEKKIPIDSVEKEWNKYTIYCKENHISWSELTFPEWMSLEAEMLYEYEAFE